MTEGHSIRCRPPAQTHTAPDQTFVDYLTQQLGLEVELNIWCVNNNRRFSNYRLTQSPTVNTVQIRRMIRIG